MSGCWLRAEPHPPPNAEGSTSAERMWRPTSGVSARQGSRPRRLDRCPTTNNLGAFNCSFRH